MDIYGVLQKLCLAPAPTGYEKEAAMVFRSEIESYVDEVRIDRMGNVIATKFGTDHAAPVIMAYAHMDQLGFMVRRIESDGFIQIDRVGGIPEKVLPALHLKIRTTRGTFVSGVIGTKAHHSASPEDKYKVDPVTSLYVDVGASSIDEVKEMGIEIGCPAIYEPRIERVGLDKVCGTALDNRGGCTALILAASLYAGERSASTIHFVGTIWEEFNIRGAVFAARAVKADISLCLDVVLASDVPDLKNRFDNALGKGPTVNLYSFHGRGTLNGTIPHEGLVKLAVSCAEENKIPLQRFASLGILTDSAYVQMENQGVACVDLGFPARYTHSPIEMCSLSDIENLGKLVYWITSKIDCNFNLNRY